MHNIHDVFWVSNLFAQLILSTEQYVLAHTCPHNECAPGCQPANRTVALAIPGSVENIEGNRASVFWLTLPRFKNAVVGCQPVIQFSVWSTHCRPSLFKTGAIAVLPADFVDFLPCSHSNTHSHQLKHEHFEHITYSGERPAFHVLLRMEGVRMCTARQRQNTTPSNASQTKDETTKEGPGHRCPGYDWDECRSHRTRSNLRAWTKPPACIR